MTYPCDSKELAKRCENFQRHGNYIYALAERLHEISFPCSFFKGRMDIVRPFLSVHRKCERFILLISDYYTKWVESKAFTNITDLSIRNFVCKHILCRFGVQNEIVTNNDSEFISKIFKDFYITGNIILKFSSSFRELNPVSVPLLGHFISKGTPKISITLGP